MFCTNNRLVKERMLAYGVKAFTVGFAEFLFLMRLCIAGAQFLSARWEGNNARYDYSSSEKSNASGAGVFRRLEQAGAANIALLVATTVTLGTYLFRRRELNHHNTKLRILRRCKRKRDRSNQGITTVNGGWIGFSGFDVV